MLAAKDYLEPDFNLDLFVEQFRDQSIDHLLLVKKEIQGLHEGISDGK